MDISRRRLIAGAAGLGGILATGIPWILHDPDAEIPERYQEGVKEAYAAAGDNVVELHKAITYFRGDKAKLESVCDSVKETAHRYFWEFDPQKNEDWRSTPNERLDAKEITARNLIDNTNYAYKALEMFPWAPDVDEEGFRTQVHPYRIGTTPIEQLPDGIHWRQPLLEKQAWEHIRGKGVVKTPYDTVKKQLDKLSLEYEKASGLKEKREVLKKVVAFLDIDICKNGEKFFYKARGPNEQTCFETYERKAGRCTDLVNLQNMWLRSIGIPASFARIIAWGLGDDNHRISLVNLLGETAGIDPVIHDKMVPTYFDVDEGLKPRYGAKIYAEKWGDWTGSSALIKEALAKGEPVPRALKFYAGTRSMHDVTSKMSDSVTNIEVDAEPGSLAILGVINYMDDIGDGLTGVAASRADRDGKAFFADVCSTGQGIIYLPVSFDARGDYKPLGSPVHAVGSQKKKLDTNEKTGYSKDTTMKHVPAGQEYAIEEFRDGKFVPTGRTVRTTAEGTAVLPKEYGLSEGKMYILAGNGFKRPFLIEKKGNAYKATRF